MVLCVDAQRLSWCWCCLSIAENTWGRVKVKGVSPSARYGITMMPFGNRVFLYGGMGDAVLQDFWSYSLGTCSSCCQLLTDSLCKIFVV
jgi:hypothetical protein